MSSLDVAPPVSVGFNFKPLFRIQSASLTVTDADKDQNDVFNTNLGAINVSMAMVIHRIQVQTNLSGLPAVDGVSLYTYILSENSSATSAVLQGNDARTLFFGQRDFIDTITTSGEAAFVYDAIQTFNLDPWPIWTISQELNWLCELTEAVASTNPDLVSRVNLWYTLEPVDAALRSKLLERLNLAL